MDKNNHTSGSERIFQTSAWWQWTAYAAALLVLLSPFLYLQRSEYDVQPDKEIGLEFVGSEKCGSCHKPAFEKWQGSHHDLAMDVATESTVLGDFNDATYNDPYNNVTSRFFRKEGGFYVETEGPDGQPGTFEISHTFGVFPLQQYLVPFPGGRLQCLNIAWDAVNSSWYRLPPYEVENHEDWLHWTRGAQTWNGMCAECHSTRLEKRFDIESESYDTRWFEIDVGCEACHGPGSRHVNWAERPEMARPQIEDYELAVNTSTTDNRKQIAVCAPCHSRRYQLGDNLHREGDILDTMVPSILEEGLYYADGQILEEVYVYGSFTQSKMYDHDVKCSDCHDMHSLSLHLDGNDLCLQCHRKEDFDTPAHHFHKQVHQGEPSDGHLCVKCHMPGTRYMGIDYRPDHSIRIPRPDLSEKIDVPNSCSAVGCHDDKPLEWINESFTKWYGTARKPHYGEILAAGRERKLEATDDLIRLAEDTLLPVIVRATALALLTHYPLNDTTNTFTRALEDEDSLIRHTAIRNLNHLNQSDRIDLIEPKLYDRVKGVRMEAAAALADVPLNSLRPENRATFKKVLAEYRLAMLYNSDFAPQRFNLGNLEANLGNNDLAISYYEQAIAIDEQFYQGKVNLAIQFNRTGQNEKAEILLKEVLADFPQLYEVAYSLGLLLAEMEDYTGASIYLGQAADNMPDYGRARYNQALALLKLKKWEQGEQAIIKALESEPNNQEYFSTLINLYLNFQMADRAKIAAEKALKHNPDHQQAQELLKSLK